MAPSQPIAPLKDKDPRKGNFLADKDKFCAYCAVRRVSFCGMVPNEVMAQLSSRSRPLTLDRRKTLFHQGDETHNVYVVTSGSLRLYQMLADGRRQVIGFAVPGDLLGFPLADRNDYSADALDSVYLCQFSRQDFTQFISQHANLMSALLSVTYDELRRAREQMALLTQKNAERKMAQFLLGFRARQNRIEGETAILPVRIPQADIGDFLGLTIETVNRMLARFMREKTILVTDTGIELLDLPRLRVLAEG
jgi:CRP/FNR family transcriptional regulator, anaerobic regulatory protein